MLLNLLPLPMLTHTHTLTHLHRRCKLGKWIHTTLHHHLSSHPKAPHFLTLVRVCVCMCVNAVCQLRLRVAQRYWWSLYLWSCNSSCTFNPFFLMTSDPLEIARQLTYAEWQIYSAIQPIGMTHPKTKNKLLTSSLLLDSHHHTPCKFINVYVSYVIRMSVALLARQQVKYHSTQHNEDDHTVQRSVQRHLLGNLERTVWPQATNRRDQAHHQDSPSNERLPEC